MKKYLSLLLALVVTAPALAIDRNVASQKLTVLAWDSATGRPKTGDSANITAYIQKDDGTVTVLADSSATEQDATNAKGQYIFDLAQAETNAIKLTFSAKSSTSGVDVYALPAVEYTKPAGMSAATTAFADTSGTTTLLTRVPATINSTAISNFNLVYNTDFATVYDTVNKLWNVNIERILDEVPDPDAVVDVNVVSRNGYDEPAKQAVPVWADGIVTAQAGSSDSNTVSITFDDSGCDYGILVINYATAASSMTFVDGKGSKWNLLDNDTNTSVKQAVYECPKPVTGSGHTITVACTGGGLPSVFFIGTRGVRLVNRADQASTNAVSTGTSVQPGSITPSENNCIVVTCLGAYAGNITAPGGGYTGNTVNTSVAHIGGGLSYIIQTTATATNPTWTKASSGDSVARSFSFLPATQIPGISLDNFADGRVFNRVFNPLTNTYQCPIAVSGKYVDEAPASVEMRITDAATSQVVTTWLPVEGLVASGGVWTGTITVDEGGWYARQARSKDGSGHVLANSITTDAKFGVGINVAMLGQSIMQRRFVAYDTPEQPNDLTRMYYQGGWTVNYGDGAIAFANDLAETTGLPIGLINYAVPGSGLVFDGGSGYWDSDEDGEPLDSGGPLELFLDALDEVGDLEVVLWDQGQCDTLNPSFDGSDYAEALDRLYSVIQTATGRTPETLKFGLTVMGPLNDPDSNSTAAVCSTLRQTQMEKGDTTPGMFISSCAIDLPLNDNFAHLFGTGYVSLGHRDAQSVLFQMGLADYPAGGGQAHNAWRRPGSAEINIPIERLSGASVYNNDTLLTGWEVSNNDFSTTLTISSTEIVGRNVVLTLSAVPTGTVKVRYGYGKVPTMTNPLYSSNTPQGDSRRVPLLPRAAMTVESRSALEATNLAAKGTLPISGSNLDIGWKLVTADGTLALERTTDGIGVVGDSATDVTYSAAVERPDEFESGFFVFDDGLGHEVSEVAVTTAEIGSDVDGFTTEERAQIMAALSIGEETGVPTAQTWKIKRIDGELKATAIVPKDVGETIDVFADFRDVLPSGDAIKPADEGGIVSITLIDDDQEGDQVESDAFSDVDDAVLWMNAGVRFTISGGTAGQVDRIRVSVLTVGGKTLSCPCATKATDAGAP